MTLREKAIAEGRITGWALSPAELAERGFYAAAEAASRFPRSFRATVELPL